MSLLDKLDKFDKKPEEQKSIGQKDLHPPKAPPMAPPKPPVAKKEKRESSTSITEFKIDWNKVAQSSDFKRAVYLALEGKSFRGSNEKLEQELNKKIEVFRDPNLSAVVKDLKEQFKNGFTKPSQMK